MEIFEPVPLNEVRNHLSDYVQRAKTEGVPTIIGIHGKASAAIVSINTLKRLFVREPGTSLSTVTDEELLGEVLRRLRKSRR